MRRRRKKGTAALLFLLMLAMFLGTSAAQTPGIGLPETVEAGKQAVETEQKTAEDGQETAKTGREVSEEGQNGENSKIPPTDWMAQIPGDTMLSVISIPGTHDSAARYLFLKSIFQCQDEDILTQVENGYRYLDIRLAIEEKDGEERLKFIHNFVDCRREKSWFSEPLYLEDVLGDLYGFLEEHPSETVIFCVKAENADDPVEKVQQLLYQAIDETPQYWYLKNEIPSLDEVRGKLVLCARYEDALKKGEFLGGMNFRWEDQGTKEIVDLPYVQSMINENQRLWVQDRYKYDVETKFAAVVEDFENCQATEDTFSLNFTSTAGKGWFGFPKQYAKTINRKILEYELKPQTCYGVVIVDFGSRELARHIYETNFM